MSWLCDTCAHAGSQRLGKSTDGREFEREWVVCSETGKLWVRERKRSTCLGYVSNEAGLRK